MFRHCRARFLRTNLLETAVNVFVFGTTFGKEEEKSRKKKAWMHVFVLCPSIRTKHFEIQSRSREPAIILKKLPSLRAHLRFNRITFFKTAVNVLSFGAALVPINSYLLSLKNLSKLTRTLLHFHLYDDLSWDSCKLLYFRDCPCTNKVPIIRAFYVSGRKQQFLKIVFVRGRLLANS